MVSIDSLVKGLDRDDLRYLSSYQTKPFRLFKSDCLAKLSPDIMPITKRSEVNRAKIRWSSMSIEQKLYYCQRADCFHSRTKLTIIRRCKFPGPLDLAAESATTSTANKCQAITPRIKLLKSVTSTADNAALSVVDANNNNLVVSNSAASTCVPNYFNYYWSPTQVLYFGLPAPMLFDPRQQLSLLHPMLQQQQQLTPAMMAAQSYYRGLTTGPTAAIGGHQMLPFFVGNSANQSG
ncbi:hypothetical protein BOX15_Mlig033418g1 [Macrostomum lignano]|uniref:Uncharacterized protein n=1 Tax=Macrostomum lignano TaxID=282301 RepID=A0A267DKS0_9PLAT|nr:hypothetical protein BOX15_Mlig033418g3 [Macrostomum lignano]PAA49254.1 hypothetical protein BOX15_Mlig033418g1 [Macrostomum lignano]